MVNILVCRCSFIFLKYFVTELNRSLMSEINSEAKQDVFFKEGDKFLFFQNTTWPYKKKNLEK